MRNRILTPVLIGVMALALLTIASSAQAMPFTKMITGTWRTLVTLPPTPILDNPLDVVAPYLAVLTEDGRAVVMAGAPAFPFPVNGTPVPMLTSTATGSWEKAGSRMRMTTWTFLSDPDTGQPVGFLRVHVETWPIAWDVHMGEYLIELLDMNLNRVQFAGQDVAIQGPVLCTRILPEPLTTQ